MRLMIMELVVSAAAPFDHNEKAGHVGENFHVLEIAKVAHETSAPQIAS
jgi:hypothetical protein